MEDRSRSDGLLDRALAATPHLDPVTEAQVVADLESALLGRPRAAIWLSRYLLIERVGAGGVGVVYSAYDPELDRKVAVKLLHDGRAEGSGGSARLMREARAMARLSHPNVVPVYDVGAYRPSDLPLLGDGGSHGVFVVMELVEGPDLRHWLQERTRTQREVLDVFVEAGGGLAAAHAEGIVHRDFKPSNVLIGVDHRPKVTDFGLARSVRRDPVDGQRLEARSVVARADPRPPPVDCDATNNGAVIGTPRYMAPEQHEGKVADARTDQYSFFVALYEGVFGATPFPGATLDELRLAKLAGLQVDAKLTSGAPRWLRDAIARGLQTDPDRRFDSMRAAIDALTANRRRSRRAIILGGTAIAGLSAAAAVFAGSVAGDRDAVCDAPELEIASQWDETARANARRAFIATKAPYAEHSWRSIDRQLTDYTMRWSAARDETCRATLERREQPLQVMSRGMLCLDDARLRLVELVRQFEHADAAVVEGSVQAVLSLPAPAACEVLESNSEPLDGPARGEITAIQQTLARAHARFGAGAMQEAVDAATEARERARALGRPEIEARVLLDLAGLELDVGRGEAQAHFGDALVLAEGAGHHDLATRALVGLVDAERALVRYAHADLFARLARARLDHPQVDAATDAELLAGVGKLRHDQGRYAEAEALHRNALALREQAFGSDHPQVATSWHNLGAALLQQARYDEAAQAHTAALAIRKRLFGAAHPLVADSLANLSGVATSRTDYETGLEYGLDALTIQEQAFGRDSVRVAGALGIVATARYHLLQFEASLDDRRRVLELIELAVGPDHLAAGGAKTNLAVALYALGREQECLAAFDRAIEIFEAAVGAHHPSLITPLTGKGFVLARRQRAQEARELAERALGIAEQRYGLDHPLVAYPLTVLGEAWLRLGDPQQALEPLERAVAVRHETPVDPANLAETGFALARALAGSGGDMARAATLAHRARAGFEQTGRRSAEELTAVDAWLAETASVGNDPPRQ